MDPSIVGVAGLGLLGRGIVTSLLAHGFHVVAFDVNPDALPAARKHIGEAIDDLTCRGALPAQIGAEWSERFLGAENIAAFGPCSFVIESIPEDAVAKQKLFADLESVVSISTPIASNTSGLPISMLQTGRKYPARFVGMHWAEPCHLTRFLEVVRGDQTNETTVEAALDLGRRCGKDPTLVRRDVDGFVVNRLGYAMFREAFWLLEQGVADVETIDRAFRNALSIWANIAGPFRWMDLTGIPAYAAVMERLFPKLSRSTHVPEAIKRLVDSGAKGIANGHGFYQYTPEEAREWQSRWVENVWRVRQIQEELLPPVAPQTGDKC